MAVACLRNILDNCEKLISWFPTERTTMWWHLHVKWTLRGDIYMSYEHYAVTLTCHMNTTWSHLHVIWTLRGDTYMLYEHCVVTLTCHMNTTWWHLHVTWNTVWWHLHVIWTLCGDTYMPYEHGSDFLLELNS